MNTIFERIDFARKQKGLSYRELGDLFNISGDAVRKSIERENMKPIYINTFSDKYGISKKWLETGDGSWENKNNNLTESINKENSELIQSPVVGKVKKKDTDLLVPFYDIDFAAGNELVLVDNTKVTPDYYMDVPEFSGCTAFRAYSDSMERLIKSGNILFGTKVDEWHLHLEYGQIYGIICTDGRRYLKYIRRHQENSKEYFLLKSENDSYDDFDIPKKSVRSIWLIHGWLNKRT